MRTDYEVCSLSLIGKGQIFEIALVISPVFVFRLTTLILKSRPMLSSLCDFIQQPVHRSNIFVFNNANVTYLDIVFNYLPLIPRLER